MFDLCMLAPLPQRVLHRGVAVMYSIDKYAIHVPSSNKWHLYDIQLIEKTQLRIMPHGIPDGDIEELQNNMLHKSTQATFIPS